MTEPTGYLTKLRKLIRFAELYGWQRALAKAVARIRPMRIPWGSLCWGSLRRWPVAEESTQVSVIGCGQFAFSTLCFFLQKQPGVVFLDAFDTNSEQARSLVRRYGFRRTSDTVDELLNNPALQLLYIASNHASHTTYAIRGLNRHVDVYVEKPIAVTHTQLVELLAAARQSGGRLYAGYNRPYARAIQLLKPHLLASDPNGSFSLSYHVNGHRIPPGHWYRHPDEGTRICGNLGHWIDLTIHLLGWRGLPHWIDVQVAWANPAEPDDNLTVTLTTDRHDLVTVLLTSRSEPFEGVSESINLQYGDVIARIDDFRSMTIWRGATRQSWPFRPKDVGHERAVLQPFRTDNRDWQEVELSTLLTLAIRDAVLERRSAFRVDLRRELSRLATDVQHVLTQRLALPE